MIILFWKLVTCRGCTRLSVQKSNLLLLQVTFPQDVTCLILMGVSFAFWLPSWAFRKLGTWPDKVRSVQAAWCSHTTWVSSHVICCPWGHTTQGLCACWCWFSHGTHLGAPEAWQSSRGEADPGEGVWLRALHSPAAPGGSGTPPGGSRLLLAHLHKAGRL